MRQILFVCASFLLAVALWQTPPVTAQTHSPTPGAEGELKGLVLDPRNSRVADAKITVENKKYKFEVWSNDEGAFEVRLPAGEYQLKVEGNGFKPYIRKRVRIEADKTETLNVVVVVQAPPDLIKLKPGI